MSEALAKIGSLIKEARSDQGLSVKDLSDKSRVGYTNIINIEEGIRDELPEDACLNGFLKILLKTLKIEDANNILSDYSSNLSEQSFVNLSNSGKEVSPELTKLKRVSTLKNILKVLGFLFILVLSFGFFLKNCSQKISNTASLKTPTLKIPDKETGKNQSKAKEKTKESNKASNLIEQKAQNNKAKAEKKNIESKKKKVEKAKEIQKAASKEIAEKKIEKTLKEIKKEDIKKPEPKKEIKPVIPVTKGKVKLNFEIVDTAWFQIISVDTGKVLYEGDVFPNFGQSSFSFADKYGFVLASGNAAAFKIKDKSKDYVLGGKDQLIKWYYPASAKDIYYQRRASERSE